MSERSDAILRFLDGAGWGDAVRKPLAGDASFRRYERLIRRKSTRPEDAVPPTVLLMDAPPPEDVRPFLKIDHILQAIGLAAPKVFAADEAHGFVLLEDFGDDTFTRVLARTPERERALYELATDVLIALGRRFAPGDRALPRFDDTRAIAEAERLLDWLWPAAFGQNCGERARAEFADAWRAVLPLWRAVPETLILGDFHVDNLMVRPGVQGLAACGLLDFQDGVTGPLGFDLMSLLQDVRRDVADGLAHAMIARFLGAFPEIDRRRFAVSYAVGGAQRNVRILGTFARLWRRDRKPGFLRWLPRTWAMVERNLALPELGPVRDWFDRHFPVDARRRRLAQAQEG
jgi:aminoglycoside/choline kinase family phosphotransferase